MPVELIQLQIHSSTTAPFFVSVSFSSQPVPCLIHVFIHSTNTHCLSTEHQALCQLLTGTTIVEITFSFHFHSSSVCLSLSLFLLISYISAVTFISPVILSLFLYLLLPLPSHRLTHFSAAVPPSPEFWPLILPLRNCHRRCNPSLLDGSYSLYHWRGVPASFMLYMCKPH